LERHVSTNLLTLRGSWIDNSPWYCEGSWIDNSKCLPAKHVDWLMTSQVITSSMWPPTMPGWNVGRKLLTEFGEVIATIWWQTYTKLHSSIKEQEEEVLFIISLYVREEKPVVDKSYALYKASVKYWRNASLPPVSTGLPPIAIS